MFCSVELVALDRSAANFEYRNEMYQITCWMKLWKIKTNKYVPYIRIYITQITHTHTHTHTHIYMHKHTHTHTQVEKGGGISIIFLLSWGGTEILVWMSPAATDTSCIVICMKSHVSAVPKSVFPHDK
jgi:hypothetical protein